MALEVHVVQNSDQAELWQSEHNTVIPSHPLSVDDVRERLTRNRLTLAYVGEILIGNSTVRPATPDLPATVIVRILPTQRRRGHGMSYWRVIVEQGNELRDRELATVVVASNEAGLRFAQRLGFTEVDRYELDGTAYVDMKRSADR